MHHSRKGIAPYDLIQHDFRELDAVERLRTSWDTERLILIQSVQGHAHEGHGRFHGRRYPNTSIDDISRALRLDPTWVRTERQMLIDEIGTYVDYVLAGEERPSLINDAGECLLRSSMFQGVDVAGRDVLRGLYLGGLRDDAEIRFRMEAEYGITIGGGKCYLVNMKVMDALGLNGDILAHGSHEGMLDYYQDTGLIASEEGPDGDGKEYMYIRYRRGRGASDDAAIIAAGVLHGFGVALGVFLADAIDTLEKYVPVYSDQDNRLARRIKQAWPDMGLEEADVRYLSYLAAVPEHASISVPDSSLRHLMLIDRRFDITAVESHMLFVQGKRYPHMRIGIEETLNRELYKYVVGRIKQTPGRALA